MTKGNITLSQEKYDELIKSRDFLLCLEEAGVDNWEWYSEAFTLYKEKTGKEFFDD